MEATRTNRLKIAVIGVALAATGFVAGATGVAWAHDDGSTHDMSNCPMHQASEEG